MGEVRVTQFRRGDADKVTIAIFATTHSRELPDIPIPALSSPRLIFDRLAEQILRARRRLVLFARYSESEVQISGR